MSTIHMRTERHVLFLPVNRPGEFGGGNARVTQEAKSAGHG